MNDQSLEHANEASGNVPIVAEIADDGQGQASTPKKSTKIRVDAAPLPPDFENLAAVGGAVGAIVLGVWAILGSLVTPFSMINGAIGFLMGLWGLRSRKRWWAVLGIVASLIGIAMSLFEVSDIVGTYWIVEDEFE